MFTQPTSNSLYTITLLRHAESTGNAAGYYQGQSDFPLSPTGVQQANALAQRWQTAGMHFDRIIASPLSRAHQTAEIIAAALQTPIDTDALWMERNNGLLSGLTPEQAGAVHPRPAFIYPYLPIGEHGESQWELFLRAGSAVQSLLHRTPGRYLVVSHGGILNMVIYAMLGITPQANFQGAQFRFRNSAFASFTYNPGSHTWRMEGLNDHSHWQFAE